MKKISFKGIKEKAIASALITVLLFNVVFPPKSHAIKSEIADAFQTLMCWTGDAVINGLQEFFMGEPAIFEDYNSYRQAINDQNLSDAVDDNAGMAILAIIGEGMGHLPFMKKIQGAVDQLINGDDGYKGPVALIKYSVPAIVSNRVPAFDVNIFKATSNTNVSVIGNKKSTASLLKSEVQKWYYAFRNLALVGLLSILLYLGIKIIFSSAAADKAKYKSNLMNWAMALVILFTLHYMMAFTLNIIDEFNTVLSKNINIQYTETDANGTVKTTDYDNLIGGIRVQAELAEGYADNLTYTIMYCVLIAYAIMFTAIYFKRTIYMIFLTIIAPLVAVTYPIDKEKDGKSQAFDMWLKEYFFNALLQPIHLLLYYVLVTSAMDLVNENPIYAIICIGFMVPAENIIRKLFGMENYGKSSALGGFAGGALASSALQKLRGAGKKLPKPGGAGEEKTKDSGIKMASLDDVFSGGTSEGGSPLPGGAGGSQSPSGSGGGSPLSGPTGMGVRTAGNSPTSGVAGPFTGIRKSASVSSASAKFRKKQPATGMKGGDKALIRAGAKFVRKNGGTAIRKIAATTAGVAGAGMGVAAGIASGNLENVFKYGAVGAGAGAGLTNATITGATTIGKGVYNFRKGAKETYQKGYYGSEEEYQKQVLIPQLKKKNEKNKELQEKYAKLGIDMKTSTGRAALYNAGYVNEKDILSVLKVQQKSGITDDKELVQDAMLAKHMEKLSDVDAVRKELEERLRRRGLDQATIDAESNRRMKDIKKMAGLG